MELYTVLGFAIVCSFVATSEALTCYRCLYMDVKGGSGGNYGDANCKKTGDDFDGEGTDRPRDNCHKTLNLQPYEVYYNQQRKWEELLMPGQSQGYDDWLCQKNFFTMKSSESDVEVEVWYRGCQPTKTENEGCPVDMNNFFIEQDIFKGIYTNLTSVGISDVDIDGEECLCKYFLCNHGNTSRGVSTVSMVIALAAAALYNML